MRELIFEQIFIIGSIVFIVLLTIKTQQSSKWTALVGFALLNIYYWAHKMITNMEGCSFLVFVVLNIWALVTKTNITGGIIIGLIYGVSWEFITEPMWTYNASINLWRADVPLYIPFGWTTMFIISFLLSENTYHKVTGKKSKVDNFGVLMCDICVVTIVCSTCESLLYTLFHGVEYNLPTLPPSPLGPPLEIIWGYAFIGASFMTTYRIWQAKIGKISIGYIQEEENKT